MAESMPTIDLQGLTASKVFDALKCLIHALTYQQTLAKLVTYYDKRIVQDQLHSVELADLQQFDAPSFVSHLQQRRKIKDLSIILDCIADNMDSESIIESIRNHPSLHNHYCYRDRATAETMKKLSNN